jgi:hypothetical protein
MKPTGAPVTQSAYPRHPVEQGPVLYQTASLGNCNMADVLARTEMSSCL